MVKALALAEQLEAMGPGSTSALDEERVSQKPTPEQKRRRALAWIDVQVADLVAVVEKRQEAAEKLEALLDERNVPEIEREPYRQSLDGIFAGKGQR
jgi:hypothetical protein